MNKIFQIAIVGRPNVGKSSIFNRICGKRRSIVDERPGVTRDRIFSEIRLDKKTFHLVDTGGFFEGTDDSIEVNMKKQIESAIREADYILFVLDASSGVHPMDKTVFQLIKKSQTPYAVIANKVDVAQHEEGVFDLYNIGVDNIFNVSATHNRGLKTLLEHLHDIIPDEFHERLPTDAFKVCIVGKTNAGKSSLINAILQEDRVIVTDIAGTTRDEIDIHYSFEENNFVFIDTSGLRRKKHVATPADQFGLSRTQTNIQKADCNLFIIDGSDSFSQQDKRIANSVFKSGKSCLIAVNKSDLMTREQKEDIKEEIESHLGFLSLSEPLFISAKKNTNIQPLLKKLLNIKKKISLNIETSKLNQAIQGLQERNIPPKKNGKRLKIYYAVQVKKVPLEVTLFVNSTNCSADSYTAYLKKGLRKIFGLDGIPITFRYRQKKN